MKSPNNAQPNFLMPASLLSILIQVHKKIKHAELSPRLSIFLGPFCLLYELMSVTPSLSECNKFIFIGMNDYIKRECFAFIIL